MSIAILVIFDSAKINSLISDNKTLRQIKSDMKKEIYSEMDAAPANGSLKLGNSFYILSNIKSKTVSSDNSTVDADIIGPRQTMAIATHHWLQVISPWQSPSMRVAP
jgi:hypothetical protein